MKGQIKWNMFLYNYQLQQVLSFPPNVGFWNDPHRSTFFQSNRVLVGSGSTSVN